MDIKYITMIDVSLLKIACPEQTVQKLSAWVDPIKKACLHYDISSIRQVASFISQMAHESGFKLGAREDTNFSAKRLAEVWPGRYAINPKAAVKDRLPNDLAKKLGGNAVAIANNVYANRMGNGNEASGDGYKFRGAGPKQLTGRANIARFGQSVKMTVDQALAYILTLEGGVMSAGWFWKDNDLNPLADSPGVEDETQRINGGLNGLEDRRTRFNNVLAELLRKDRLRK